MTTLIAVYTSDGCEGRCDAKCYDATQPECDCVCGGANHGAGKERAVQNVSQWAESMLESYGMEHEIAHAIVFGEPAQQGRLL